MKKLLLLLMFSSCQWAEDRFVKRTVVPAELVGRWQLTSSSTLHELGHTRFLDPADDTFVLREDGSCQRSGVHRSFDGASATKFAIAHGCTWTLDKDHRGRQQLMLRYGDSSESLYLAEEDEQLIAWNYLDDPDQWKYRDYTRMPAPD